MEEYVIIEQDKEVILLVESHDESKISSIELTFTENNPGQYSAKTDTGINIEGLELNAVEMIVGKKIPLVMMDTENNVVFDISIVEAN